jgi:hypothetical protein
VTTFDSKHNWEMNFEIGNLRKGNVYFTPDQSPDLYQAIGKALFIMK